MRLVAANAILVIDDVEEFARRADLVRYCGAVLRFIEEKIVEISTFNRTECA